MNGGGPVRHALVAAVVLLMVAPPALAAQGSFEVRTDLPITVEGERAVEATGTFLLQGDAGTASFLLEATDGTVERIIHRASGYIRPDEPQAGILWDQTVEVVKVDLAGSYLSLDERRTGFTLLVTDAGLTAFEGARDDPLHMGVLQKPVLVRSEAEPPIRLNLGRHEALPFEHEVQAGQYALRATDGRVVAEGPMELYLADAVLHTAGTQEPATFRAHYREEQHPGRLYDPVSQTWTGPGTHTEYVHEYLRLHLQDARLQVQYLGTPGMVYSKAPSIAVTGTTLFPAATGTVTVTDETRTTVHRIDGEELRLGGRFTVAFDTLDRITARTDASGEGDLTQVTYAAQTHEYDWATLAAVTGLGAILAAAAAWISGTGKGLLGSVLTLLPGYARVHGEEILQHGGRSTVYEQVKAAPGSHFMDLCDRLPFGASTLNYHLRVLERNGFVTRVKDGRYVRFFDRRTGEYSQDRKKAASTLRNGTTAAIAAHIVQNPGVVQRDLARHFGIAASTVSWHVERLQQNGLVEKQRDQHYTRYYRGDAWSTLPHDELARVGLVA